MKRLIAFARIAGLICLSALLPRASATTYYVHPAGSDSSPGTSAAQAWQTLAHVDGFPLQAGDSVLFAGGQVFGGRLSFAAPRCGTAGAPIYLGSYGTGRATLYADSLTAIYIYDCAGFVIENLDLAGSGRATNDGHGIHCYTDQYRTFRLPYLRIRQVEISGFNRGGIRIHADGLYAYLGYEDIRIEHADLHDNGDHGIDVQGKERDDSVFSHRDIYIGYCTAHDNPGQIGKIHKHTGNGIVVGNTEHVLIEHCLAYNNGAENVNDIGGPVGIWLWDCKDGVIQFCESHHNDTGSTKDGGGFDLDGGCIGCTIQYCYSHDNAGAGFLVAAYNQAPPLRDATLRYNISENDGRKNGYAGIMLWRGMQTVLSGVRIYHNTIYTGPTSGPPRAWVFESIGDSIDEVVVANNIFVSRGSTRLLYKSHGPAAQTHVRFSGNTYHNIGGVFYLWDDGGIYSSLAAWRGGRGQEQIGTIPTGYQGNPLLEDPGNGGTVGQIGYLPALAAYQLQITSPLIDQGLDLDQLLNIDAGPHDFFLFSINDPNGKDIGAGEHIGTPLRPGPLADEVWADPAGIRDLRLVRTAPDRWLVTAPVSPGAFARLRVSDMQGRLLHETAGAPPAQWALHLPLVRGTYLLQVIGTEHSFQEKFVVTD
ncbi:MAG: hypothetical protein OHK0039_41740 [Bacteroidia bacterium]